MSAQPEDSLAPATQPTNEPRIEEAREIFPITMWEKGLNLDDELYDFTPKPEEEVSEEEDTESPDPKASSVPNSALAAAFEAVRTPELDFSQRPENPASVGKDNTQPSQSENGTPTSSTTPEVSSGKNEQPAETKTPPSSSQKRTDPTKP